jgi:chromosome segregation ATPase
MAENNRNRSAKKLTTFVVILIIILGGLVGAYIYQTTKLTELREDSKQMKTYLQNQRDSLQSELKNIRDQYDTLETDNDSMRFAMEKQKAKIDRLLKLRANNLYLVKKYKEELGTLRKIMKHFVVQIDSLNQLNQELVAENEKVRGRLDTVQRKSQKLEKEKEELSSKVEKAEVIRAKNIVAVGINKRSNEKDEVDKVEKIRVCFTLRENAIAKSGERMVYLRIIRPDDALLTVSEDNVFSAERERMLYSARREINYQNQDIDMCIYYNNKEGELIPGEYKALLYSGGHFIGETTFTFKEGGFLFF